MFYLRTVPPSSVPLTCEASALLLLSSALVPRSTNRGINRKNYSWSSLYFGRPLIGQRVRDILSLTAALRSIPETSGRPLHLAARGRLVFPALLAAALDPKISGLYLSGGLAALV